MPRLGGAYCFRRVRSQRKSLDWGTMGPALGGAYECYAHISSSQYILILIESFVLKGTVGWPRTNKVVFRYNFDFTVR